jgi:hypothetical protein
VWLVVAVHRVSQRLLEGEPVVISAFRRNPFASAPGARPRFMRVRWYTMVPASFDQEKATGNRWERYLTGTVMPIAGFNDRVWHEWLPTPDFFHWDSIPVWKRASPLLQGLFADAQSSLDPTSAVARSLVLEPCNPSPSVTPPSSAPADGALLLPALLAPQPTTNTLDVTSGDVSAAEHVLNVFWNEFVPAFGYPGGKRVPWDPNSTPCYLPACPLWHVVSLLLILLLWFSVACCCCLVFVGWCFV